jgi:hypothetical protein
MKKILSILALAVLTACGGGGDSGPTAPPAYNYAAHNGKYNCVLSGVNFTIDMIFEEVRATAVVDFQGIKATFVYNDKVWKFEEHPMYTDFLPGGVKAETIGTYDTNNMYMYVGPATDLTKYYTDSIFFCRK